MLKIFKKRRNVFVNLIHEQASLTLEGMELLKQYMTTPDQSLADKLTLKEKEADEARRINGAMAYLSRSASLNGSMRLGGLYTGPGLTAEMLQRQYARTVHSGVPVALIEDIGPDDPGGSLDAAISLQAVMRHQNQRRI